jgi:hypothetical protein
MAGLVALSGACKFHEIEDEANVCVYAGESVLRVHASSFGCESDHRNAYLECTITVDGEDALVETVFKDGHDPNDACAPPLETTCEVTVTPGDYTLHFGDEQQSITVPDGGHACFGYAVGTDTGWP